MRTPAKLWIVQSSPISLSPTRPLFTCNRNLGTIHSSVLSIGVESGGRASQAIYCASVSPSVRYVSSNVRLTLASVSRNVRRKWAFIARRAVHHCAPLQLWAAGLQHLRGPLGSTHQDAITADRATVICRAWSAPATAHVTARSENHGCSACSSTSAARPRPAAASRRTAQSRRPAHRAMEGKRAEAVRRLADHHGIAIRRGPGQHPYLVSIRIPAKKSANTS
jgi:hypothetical protein